MVELSEPDKLLDQIRSNTARPSIRFLAVIKFEHMKLTIYLFIFFNHGFNFI